MSWVRIVLKLPVFTHYIGGAVSCTAVRHSLARVVSHGRQILVVWACMHQSHSTRKHKLGVVLRLPVRLPQSAIVDDADCPWIVGLYQKCRRSDEHLCSRARLLEFRGAAKQVCIHGDESEEMLRFSDVCSLWIMF